MADFFGNEEPQNNEENVESQEQDISEEVTESDHEDQESGEEIASGEDTEYEEEDLQEEEPKQDQKAEITKIKEDAQNWVRSMQSGFDKQRAEDQRTIIEMQSQLRAVIESQKSHDEVSPYVDEYDNERPPTESERKAEFERMWQAKKASEMSTLEKQQREQESVRHQQRETAETWLYAQPDIKEVHAFYERNLKNDPLAKSLDYQALYYYAKSKKFEKESRKPKKQKKQRNQNITPTGAPNRNFSSRGSTAATNDLMSSLESLRKDYGKRNTGFF